MNLPFEEILQRLERIETQLLTEVKEEPELPIQIDEACKVVKRSKAGMYTLVSKRLVPFHKKHKKLYFFKSELIQWVRDGKKLTKAEISSIASNQVALG